MRILRRIGLVDLLLIALFLFGVIGAFLRFGEARTGMGAMEEGEVLLCVRGIAGESAECVQIGEALFDASGEIWGEIEETRTSPSSFELIEDGVVYTGSWEPSDRCDLYLTVLIKGRVEEDRFLKNGREILREGMKSILYTMRAELSAYIVRSPAKKRIS